MDPSERHVQRLNHAASRQVVVLEGPRPEPCAIPKHASALLELLPPRKPLPAEKTKPLTCTDLDLFVRIAWDPANMIDDGHRYIDCAGDCSGKQQVEANRQHKEAQKMNPKRAGTSTGAGQGGGSATGNANNQSDSDGKKNRINANLTLLVYNLGWSGEGGVYSGLALGIPSISVTWRVAGPLPRKGSAG